MHRIALGALALYYALTALYIGLAPHTFFANTPGVSVTGGFNHHFLMDIAFAFATSSGLLAWGLKTKERAYCVAGSIWVGLHGLFHLWIQLTRGFPLDIITASDMGGVVLPAAASLWLTLNWKD